jgi:ABC-type multidrug transport system ATPase subunit
MIQLILDGIEKKFEGNTVIHSFSQKFQSPDCIALTGPNGSGKSTLVKMISGYVSPDQGTISYHYKNEFIKKDNIYLLMSMAAPWMEMMDELTFGEAIRFHASFRNWRNGLTSEQIIRLSGLKHVENKLIRNFSSGMKQRVRLVLAILSDSPILLLDEPTSNLDKSGIQWFQELLLSNMNERLVFIASNHQKDEVFCCNQHVEIAKG